MSAAVMRSDSELSPTSDRWGVRTPIAWSHKSLKWLLRAPLAYGVLKPDKYDGEDGVPIVRIMDVSRGEVATSALELISPEMSREYTRTLIQRGDLVISVVGTLGRCFVVANEHEGMNLSRALARVQLGANAEVHFLNYWVQSAYFEGVVDLIAQGSAQRVLNLGDLREFKVECPPLEEQAQIAKFLDYETAKIDALIDKQQQLIALLKEKRQAVISVAVTKGLNPDAPMKDFGVEWLGEVPAHWEVLPLRRLLASIEQGSSPVANNVPPAEGEYGVLKLSAVKRGEFLATEAKTLDAGTPFESEFAVRQGDVLVTRGNTPDLVADACVVLEPPPTPVMMSDLIYRLNVNGRVSSEYLCFCLLSSFSRAQIKNDARGSSMSMAKISQGHIRAWLAAIPSRQEQDMIVATTRNKLGRLDALIESASAQTELLQERRTALISAAVTGKIDVRGWQPPSDTDADKEVA